MIARALNVHLKCHVTLSVCPCEQFIFPVTWASQQKLTSRGSPVFFIVLSAIRQTLNKSAEPIQSTTNNVASVPKKQRKVMALQETVEWLIGTKDSGLWLLLPTISREIQHHYKRKGNLWGCPCSHASRHKNLALFVGDFFNLILKMQLLCWGKAREGMDRIAGVYGQV